MLQLPAVRRRKRLPALFKEASVHSAQVLLELVLTQPRSSTEDADVEGLALVTGISVAA